MSHRSHLFSLRPAHALRESLSEGYDARRLGRDLTAGLTVGLIAIPLSMALAIASGVAPQYGLYTAIIGGFLIALLGGSRYSISGPTAAFVVILYPVAQNHGLTGLLLATMMAGVLLVAMAVLRLGRLIEYIPPPVTLGFTAGIAVVIATLQIKDFLGLPLEALPASFPAKLAALVTALPALHPASLTVAVATLATLLIWPRLKTPLPPHLPAVLVGALLALWFNHHGAQVPTIASRFHYVLDNGLSGQGIPPVLPELAWPWARHGETLAWGALWEMAVSLVPTAFAIAMLGAIESLLCAVVLDGMTGRRHSANSELLGQGIGNMVVPLFGGITATAALARSAANYKAGAQSPVAAMVHALVVLLAMVVLARWLGYLPMPAMAALLMLVAWNMSEAPKALKLVRRAPLSDVLVFLTCFGLTVLVDMVVAITVGVVLAALLFVREIAAMTRVADITRSSRVSDYQPPADWGVFKISGALFFAAADRVFAELAELAGERRVLVLYMDGVPVMDAGGLAALEGFLARCEQAGTRVRIADLQFQPLKTLARAGVLPREGAWSFHSTLDDALRAPA
ncbi:C4-dicarboxylic acid transporter DauA [Alloalcanivorax gelatiniphagus]|uniref:C4-dicarboxylic acid transporter DauA n=1 Tax=Alloalcanivorax gelatiniphagus TaxID=1194167 RepID=A0ABY2XQA6_9GAMM|nr:C4-dicarboxylic acid transporter DauA [Alloalcanivorax gelatiniphagus]TMW14952.1 C4-dicarboxylic acid transporter DauA [Alloalcanivorax gelatiniphagus]